MLEGHIYKTFDLELKELKEKLLYEGGLVEKAISSAIKALLERNSELADKVIEDDPIINALEVEIDEFCLKLLALRQPQSTGIHSPRELPLLVSPSLSAKTLSVSTSRPLSTTAG